MTLNFEETTPGVHMAMWEGTKSKAARTVVIIESLGHFTLYIDGNVAARDLDTFDAAVARAHSTLSSSRARRMVQIAAGLVAVTALGGTAVGFGHLVSNMSVAAVNSSVQTTETAEQNAQFTRFTPVKPRTEPVVINRVEVPQQKPVNPVTTVVEAPEVPKPEVKIARLPEPTKSEQATIELVPTSAPVAISERDEVPAAAITTDQPAAPAATTAEPKADTGPRVFSASSPLNDFSELEKAQQQEDNDVERIPVATLPPAAEKPVTEAPVIIPNDGLAATRQDETAEFDPALQTEVALTQDPDPDTIPLPDRNPQVRVDAVAPGFAPITTSSVSPYSPGDEAPTAGRKTRAKKLYRDVTKRKKAKRKIRRAKKKSSSRTRTSRRRIRIRKRRVVRCIYGGCRIVTVGGYYDRMYRRRVR